MPLLSEPEEFVLRSGVRSGLKREFAFALKAQAELPASLGRTRSAKASPPLRPSQATSTKRIKRSDGLDAPKPDAGPLDGRHVAGMDGQDGSKEEIASPPPPTPASEKPLRTYARKGTLETSFTFLQIDGRDGPSVEIGLPVRNSRLETPILIDSQDGSELHVRAPEKPVDGQDALDAGSRASEKDPASEIPVVIDGQDGPKVDVDPLEKLIDGLDGLDAEIGSPDKNSGSDTSMVIDGQDGSNADSGLWEKNCNSETVMVIDGQDVSNVDAEPPEKPVRRFTRSVLSNSEDAAITSIANKEDCLVETPINVIDLDGLKIESNALEKHARRFTRSLLKVTSIKLEEPKTEGPVTINDQNALVTINDQNALKVDESKPEYSTKRITRSAVKAENVAVAENGSAGFDEVKAGQNAMNGSLATPPKRKMELKMSKKIALTKLPTNVRELLATGLLEGLIVRYVACSGSGKQVGLSGVIKDGSILCSCDSCKGSKAVSAFQFEIHAGSTKKHPSDFIYLENGKSLRDILKACTTAPLDMLEAAVQNAIGPVPPRKPSTCQKCKESFHTLRTGKFAMLCDSCLQLKQLQTTPSPMAVTDSSEGSPRPVSIPSPSESSSKSKSSNKKNSYGRITRKDIGLHKLVFMGGILPEGTEVAYYVRGKKLLEGYIKDSGIFCRCCNSVVSPSLFEAHAGRAQRRKPYNNIYTSNGVSLHELSVSLSKGRKLSATENDDLCSICADGGDLLLCDLCPRAFHKECVGLSTIPKGDYYCQYCRSLHQREKCLAHNDNAIAAGRVAGVDPIQQIFQRCIRIVKTPETDVGGCVLCRCQDFSKSKFSPRTVLLCDQCEKEYHVGCLKDHNMADLKELPEGEWFCCMDCNRIYSSLKEFLHGAGPVQGSCYDLIKKKHEEKGLNKGLTVDVRWRLLSGKSSCADTKLLLSKAVAIFHECFDPIVDVVTGRDLIPSMVYGRTVRDQDYGGIYCAILTVDSSVVSAGILRVLGGEVAELPLVATHRESQGQGYFQALFSCIERLLGSLNVKHFLLPAADEAESIWTKKFGFSKITAEQVHEYAKGAKPLVFQGTSMLHKLVPHSSPEKS